MTNVGRVISCQWPLISRRSAGDYSKVAQNSFQHLDLNKHDKTQLLTKLNKLCTIDNLRWLRTLCTELF